MKVSFCVVIVVCAKSEWQEAHAVFWVGEESRPTSVAAASRLRFFGADRAPAPLSITASISIRVPGRDRLAKKDNLSFMEFISSVCIAVRDLNIAW